QIRGKTPMLRATQGAVRLITSPHRTTTLQTCLAAGLLIWILTASPGNPATRREVCRLRVGDF
ncbi:MAG: hypothetical protein ACK559_21055, partial [bacterium]